MHSAVGRKAGITKEQYLSLVRLDKKDFPRREWIALVYAREWTFSRGRSLSSEFLEEYNRLYSPREQSVIMKMMRTMLFANYCGNGYFKRPWKNGASSQMCEVNFDKVDESINSGIKTKDNS